MAAFLECLRGHRRKRARGRELRPTALRFYHPNLESLERRNLPSGTAPTAAQLAAAYGQIPIHFEANQGQVDPQVRFVARGQSYALFLTDTEAVLRLRKSAALPPGIPGPAPAPEGSVLRVQLVGGKPTPAVTGTDALAETSNYFLGNDPRQWHAAVPTYGRVTYHNVYAGVDLIYYGNQEQLEYDFTVAPGADPGLIRLNLDGAQAVRLDGQGSLIVRTAGGDLIEHAPVVYQDGAGGRVPVAGRFVLEGGQQVGFAVAAYDRSRPLTIDPTLTYSTYLGGSGVDRANAIAVDAAGNAYITGSTMSANFPTTGGAFQTSLGSPFGNAFVAKLNAAGTALLYSTYLGGSGSDSGTGIAVDATGNAYLTGQTSSSDFPTTAGAFQTTSGGGPDAFVTKLNADGTALVYSTYLGGSGNDSGAGIAVDGTGNAYVTGSASSSNFPTTVGAFQTTLGGSGSSNAFVTKLNASGSAAVYSTYLGGSANDSGSGIAVDAAGSGYVTGMTASSDFPTTPGAFQTQRAGSFNAFVAKFNLSGTGLLYSTYLGGSVAAAEHVAVDAAGNAYVAGYTGPAFPTTAGAFQTTYPGNMASGFVTKLNAVGTGLLYSTYLGGRGNDFAFGIAVDAAGDAFITGSTNSVNFPTTPGAFQSSYGSTGDAFVTKLNATGTGLLYSTYFGGSGLEYGLGIAVDAADNAYIAGPVDSGNFPVTTGSFQTAFGGVADAFVTKFALAEPLAPPVRFFAVGGVPGRVRVYKPDNTLVADFAPYGAAYTDPVTVAVGDVTGDGVDDLVTGAAAGNPDVHVYDGAAFANGTFDADHPDTDRIAQWFPYALQFNVGATVAVGDIEHNGLADIVTGATVGNPDVRVYRGADIGYRRFDPNGRSLIAQWFPYALNFNVGANVAVGDVTGDGFADVVTGATAGNPDVRVYNGKDIAQGTFSPTGASLLAQFFPYALQFNVGAFVAVGDTAASGFGDVITGATAGNPDVRVYRGADIATGTFDNANPDGSRRTQFFAYDLNFNIGAAVASADFENNGRFDILTGASAGTPHYRVVKGDATGVQPPALFEGIPGDLQGGIAVGA